MKASTRIQSLTASIQQSQAHTTCVNKQLWTAIVFSIAFYSFLPL